MSDRFSFDPWSDLKNYREAFRQFIEGGWVLPRDLMPSAMNAVVVPVDVLDNGTEIVVKAGLPGARPEDLSISVLDGTLTIRANLNADEDIKGATYLRRERRAAAFVRSLTLPMPVNAEQAEARFKNGVLTLTLPKSESVRPRIIRVEPE
jgi:HSP20 family protein